MKKLFFALAAMLAVFACNKPDVEETPVLEVSTQKITINSFGGDRVLNITSNNAWVIQADADWISFSENNGEASAQKQEIKVYIDENTAAEARTAKITVKSGPLEKVVDVEQEAATETPDPNRSEWALVGTFGADNNWNLASELYLSVLDEEYFVYYGLELATDSEFKFLKGGAWPPAGQEIGGNGLVEPNTIQPAGGSNIKVTEAGKYDIYLAADLTKFYIMSEGKLPAEAVEPAPVENQWGMMGCFVDNQWATDVPMTKEGEWIVAKGAQFTELTFKIRANASWADGTNIGRAPGSERAVVNGKIDVVTAEYAKANLGGDAADIKLNGEPGTYDVYFSFENLEVYVMEAGFKPGEKEPQNPDPVEITYTVVGTIADNVWSNNAEIGLMAKEGDYLVAKNIPFVWNSTCYDGDYNRVEFKIVETGTWDGFAYPEKNIDQYANAEIKVQIGGENIALNAPEGSYDVYFDKANLKVWVMEAGFKPGEKEPLVPQPEPEYTLDGKQWMAEVEGMQVLFDFGLAEEEMLSVGTPSMDGTGFGLYMAGLYEIVPADATSGVIKFTQYDWEWDEFDDPVEIPYSELTETTVKAVFEGVFGTTDPISFTLVENPYEIASPQTGGDGPSGAIENGEYWFFNGEKVMAPLAEDVTTGTLPAGNVISGASTEKNIFTLTYDPDWTYYTIQDSYGRYLGQTDETGNITVTDVLPTDDTYAFYLWAVETGYGEACSIYNASYSYDITYSAANNNWVLVEDGYEYPETLPVLVKAENPVEEPEVPGEMEGDGTEANPYIIKTAEHMTQMREKAPLGATTWFKMANDIDMASITNWVPVNYDQEYKRQIHFDGGNYTLSNFAPQTYTNVQEDGTEVTAGYHSLFGILYGSCKNLKIKNVTITATNGCGVIGGYVGTTGLPGLVENVTVTNASITNSGDRAGGICGTAKEATFKNVSFQGTVICTYTAKEARSGGFAGLTETSAVFENCSADVVVVGDSQDLGGFVGKTTGEVSFKGCSVKADITSNVATKNRCGGFIGWNSTGAATFTNCHVLEGSTITNTTGRGSVSNGNFGGFIGFGDTNGTVLEITDCSAHVDMTVDANSTYNGGFIGGNGYTSTTTIRRCSAAGTVNGNNYVGGFIGAVQAPTVIEQCFSSADVTSTGQRSGSFVGVATAEITIRDCYSTGDITANGQQVGGILGYTGKVASVIERCYATGDVTSNTAGTGGILGTNQIAGTKVSKCIAWNQNITCNRADSGKWAPGAVVGASDKNGTFEDCYRRTDMNFVDKAGAMVLVDQENVYNGLPAAPEYSSEATQAAYHGKAAAADATVSSVAKELGWDETIWDLSGAFPTLK